MSYHNSHNDKDLAEAQEGFRLLMRKELEKMNAGIEERLLSQLPAILERQAANEEDGIFTDIVIAYQPDKLPRLRLVLRPQRMSVNVAGGPGDPERDGLIWMDERKFK